MCGITGIYAYNEVGRFHSINLKNSLDTLNRRGPDAAQMSLHHMVSMGHARLSIIDLSRAANQPMRDESRRYTLVFNGEIYNYKSIREELVSEGFSFQTTSDTEVLLKGYIQWQEKILNKLNGFFAFAIYDEIEKTLFLARDRMGIKPLLVYEDENKLLFASEMKAILAYGIDKEIDYVSLKQYLQFNYIPGTKTIFRKVRKLAPGHYLKIKGKTQEEHAFYQIPVAYPSFERFVSYEAQKTQLINLLEASVQKRLIADVPLGAFLSGGIDSSVITALASRHTPQLNTFSIGYRDEPFFDETKYASLVAKKYNTNHTVFSLSNQDLYAHLFDVLDYTDEPFADSSALAVYILSQRTRSKVKVALSGDGADELFSGYNKHSAEYRARAGGWQAEVVSKLLPLWQRLPKSRQGFLSNKFRQLQRFAEGQKLSEKERYWRWAIFADEAQAEALLHPNTQTKIVKEEYQQRKQDILYFIHNTADASQTLNHFNEVLYTDLQLVLVSDMLTKVDLMSMSNSLEVRVPFLDHELVDYVSNLPVESKINAKMRKRILQDAFRELLPVELYLRPKHGFEVPLLGWMRSELRSTIEDDLLADDWVEAQGIFDLTTVRELKQKLFSNNPEDIHARIWGLLVFQHWWKKYMS